MDEEIECKTRVEIHCALVVNTTQKNWKPITIYCIEYLEFFCKRKLSRKKSWYFSSSYSQIFYS